MCFSATASFLVSGVLFSIGFLTVRKIKKPQQRYFAAIPFLFAIQQAAEGVIWITGTNPTQITQIATYLFLTIAFLIWPFWIALSIMKLERQPDNRRILYWLFLFGLLISGYFLYILASHGAIAKLLNCHIYYHFISYNPYFFDMGYLYIIPVILPFFFSTVPRMKTMGLLISVALIISYYYWQFFFTSIWCFFAALISMLVLTIL